LSILAEPPVSVVDKVVDRHGTRKVAEEYLKYPLLQGGPGNRARSTSIRPRDPAVAAKYAGNSRNIPLVTIDAVFGGWTKAQATHFADHGTFDRIYGQ
jgi:sulfate/thiosulfate transport system substrate-binding protein